jgi:hypothetical protein
MVGGSGITTAVGKREKRGNEHCVVRVDPSGPHFFVLAVTQ